MNDKNSLIIGIIVLVIAGTMAYSWSKNGVNPNPSVSPTVSPSPTFNLTPTPQSSITPTPQPAQKAIINQIIIKTGIDIDKTRQYTPYELKIAKGHYLIWVYDTKKLIYDGNEINSEKNIGGLALSHNGLHYAYIIKNDNTNDLYIDNQKIISASNLQLPAITDDGKHYFYTTTNQTRSIGNTLFKDGKEILKHDAGILGLWISDEGSNYLTYLTESTGYSLILNGKEIYKGVELKENKLSDNGLHYVYIENPSKIGGTDGKFIVDGEVKLEGANLNYSQITNSGHYAIADTNNRKIYIDNKSYIVNSPVARVFINDNASHYLTQDGMGVWKLDGNIISLENTKGGVEIDDNNIYVYGLVK